MSNWSSNPVADDSLVEFTARIVSAYLSNHSVEAFTVPEVINLVYRTARNVGAAKDEPAEATKPAVSVRSSVKPDHIVCLKCGKKTKLLKRHLSSEHGMTPGAYRAEWGLPDSYPMVATNYSAERRAAAKAIGLGRRK